MAGKVFVGTVVSAKMQDTVVVRIDRKVRHPIYGKVISRSKKIKAHVSKELKVREGDQVKIGEVRPISKSVSFEVID